MIQLGYLIPDMHQPCYLMTAFLHTLRNTLFRPITTVLLLLSSMVIYINYTFVGFNQLASLSLVIE